MSCQKQPSVTVHEQEIQTVCTQIYDPQKDYFPDKISPRYAQGFKVEYHNNYKLVTVKQPWEDATNNLQYLLVQCGTPIPKNYPQATVIEVPTGRAIAMSTTYLPYLDKLQLLDHLVGVSDRRLITNATIRKKIEQGIIQEVGDLEPDAEKIVSLKPDIIFSYRLGKSESNYLVKLKDLGLTIVLDAAHLESTPLGRAEWIKFTALFFNQEAAANQIFTGIAQRYQTLKEKVKTVDHKPTILNGSPYQGTWFVPGGKSYFAQFFIDAGGDYLWKNSDSRLSLSLDFETVLGIANQAEIWLNPNPDWKTEQDMLKEDQRYQLFAATKSGQIYIPNARITPEGGNDFWESGAAEPDVVLADLIKIMHPDRLPDHQLVYYRQITKNP